MNETLKSAIQRIIVQFEGRGELDVFRKDDLVDAIDCYNIGFFEACKICLRSAFVGSEAGGWQIESTRKQTLMKTSAADLMLRIR